MHYRLAEALGYRLVRRDRDTEGSLSVHVAELVRRTLVDCILDVGANRGQYAKSLRAAGYSGRIVSFEPLPECVAELERLSHDDPSWLVRGFALGKETARLPLRRMRNSELSTFLAPSDVGRRVCGEGMDTQATVEVEVRRLDDVLRAAVDGLVAPRVFLKLDTQGYDLEVFEGASGVLDRIVGLQSELSVIPLYEGMPSYIEALATYRRAGFEVTGFFPVFRLHPTLIIGEFDCVMTRRSALECRG
jgi:FkbM family methyltransferase